MSGKLKSPVSITLGKVLLWVVRRDRTCKKGHEGGGVINAVRKDTACSGEDTLDTDCEIAWNKIQLKGCKHYTPVVSIANRTTNHQH
jgi:hypothetical protein